MSDLEVFKKLLEKYENALTTFCFYGNSKVKSLIKKANRKAEECDNIITYLIELFKKQSEVKENG